MCIAEEVKVPMIFFAATMNDKFKKPLGTMWEYYLEMFKDGPEVNKKKSFYCGDAAGRSKTSDKKKDFSDSDLKFALNIGLPF